MPNDKDKKKQDVSIEAGTPPQLIIVSIHAPEDSNTLVSLESPTDAWVGTSTLLRRVAGPNAPNDLVSA